MSEPMANDLHGIGRDEAATVGLAEGLAMLAVLRQFDGEDWNQQTDCPEWDVRTMVSHLVAQCEDGLRMTTLLRREVRGRIRHRDKAGVDAHMAVQVAEHRAESGPELVERFAQLWPRAVRARTHRPRPVRRFRIDLGIPGVARVPFAYLLDVIYDRDVWMHRVDLTRATGYPFVIGNHDRSIVALAVRDLALSWTHPAIVLELTGPAGGHWRIGTGEPAATVRAEPVAFMRSLAGRDPDVALDLVTGDRAALACVAQARVPF